MLDIAVDSHGSEELASPAFGALLRRFRLAARLTQEELAELSGLSARAIADIERGRTSRPYRSSVRALAAALHLSGDERDLLIRAARPRGAGPAPAPRPDAAASAGPNGETQAGVIPRQLPPAVAHFAGRRAEVDTLNDLFGRGGATVVISAIAGAAGVGKTALAVHWAHQAAGLFPDGQLYVNLRGYDPGDRVSAADALAGLLRALGVAGQDIPLTAEERAAHYRSLLADKRVLVVLDNAHDAGQVRPLLPGGTGCAVLVTSRDSMPGLVARDGAHRLELDLLPMTDAVELLTALIGTRAHGDPAATQTLATRCSRLPLALRIAAELAAARPSSPVADLAAELADQQRRIDVLNAGSDAHTAVRAVFSWSYRHLDAAQAAAFRLAGLHPAADFDAYAAAALTGTSLEHAAHQLGQLARAHLIQPTQPGRYTMHDLLRAYARELAAATDNEEHECQAALTGLFDYYLHTTATAMDTLYPSESGARPRIPAPATPGPQLTESAAARGWLDSERANLVDMAVHTAVHGWPGYTTRLSETLYRYLQLGGHCPEAVVVYRHAFRAATDLGDDAAQAAALNRLGIVDLSQGNYQQAASHLERALPLWRAAGNQTGEAHSLSNLATAETLQGSYRRAAEHYRRASARYRAAGHRLGEASALAGLAQLNVRQSRFQQAHEQLQESLNLYQQAGDQTGVAMVQGMLGEAYLRQGRCLEADELLRKMLAACRRAVDRPGEAYATVLLAGVDLKLARYEQATKRFRRSLAFYRKLGDRAGEADALNGIGEVHLATGRPGQARTAHAAAAGLAAEIGDRREQARAHVGLARACALLGEPGAAREHWLRALSIYSDLGLPEADQVRSELARAGDKARPTGRTTAGLQVAADASLD